ncbi:hypothetical protein M9H77_08293 [Catharanthus roseus]|uniref:Uncharacterized protein n=1 Tax=Catharanthus roseus TaxID=4058 RepID=A0ACC0BXM6_CATRO|nr:hypothetical protein M9H77_08293 [Catharanthus roseus]
MDLINLYWLEIQARLIRLFLVGNGPRKYGLRTALANCKQGGDSNFSIFNGTKWCNLWNYSFSSDSIGTHTKNENNSCPNLQRRTTQKHGPNGRQWRRRRSLRRRQNRTHSGATTTTAIIFFFLTDGLQPLSSDLEQEELADLLLPSAANGEVTQQAGVRTAGGVRVVDVNGGTSFSSKNGSNQIGSPSTNGSNQTGSLSTNGSHCFGNFPNLDSNQWSKLLTLLNNPTPRRTDTLSVSLPNGAKALALQGGKISLNPKLTLQSVFLILELKCNLISLA